MKLAIAAFALVGLAVAQSVHQIPIKEVRLVGEVPAEWWTYVYVNAQSDGTPFLTYSVPADRYLVVTSFYKQGLLRVNGADLPALEGVYQNAVNNNGTRVAIPPGALVESYNINAGAQAKLWGYLEPVR